MVILMEKSSTLTFQFEDSKIDELKEFYKENMVDSNNQYVLFLAKLNGVSITAYKTNKVVFQGKNASEESLIWQEEQVKWVNSNEQIGSDEVGTGDYFGPISVCAAYVSKTDVKMLDMLGVGDSKKIDDDKIMKIAPILLKKITYSQISVSPQKYNRLIAAGYNQAKIKVLLHNQVLFNLKKKIGKEKIFTVVDQFLSGKKYFEYLGDSKDLVRDIHFETKAEDKFPSVATASIIARYSFLIKMKALSNTVGKEIPKGAGKQVDTFAQKVLDKFGMEKLEKMVKIHFSNTRKLKVKES